MKKIWLGILLTLSTAAFADRCAFNQTTNEPECCQATEQAIFSPIYNEVTCTASQTGDSCQWDDLINEVQCCDTSQHGVWDPIVHELDCYTF